MNNFFKYREDVESFNFSDETKDLITSYLNRKEDQYFYELGFYKAGSKLSSFVMEKDQPYPEPIYSNTATYIVPIKEDIEDYFSSHVQDNDNIEKATNLISQNVKSIVLEEEEKINNPFQLNETDVENPDLVELAEFAQDVGSGAESLINDFDEVTKYSSITHLESYKEKLEALDNVLQDTLNSSNNYNSNAGTKIINYLSSLSIDLQNTMGSTNEELKALQEEAEEEES